MSLRLVLASAPVRLSERYGQFTGAASTEPSFALVSLAAVALRAGTQVHIVEASSRDLTVNEAAGAILALSPDVVGLTATTVGVPAAGELADRLKQARPGLVVLLGGCHATSLPEETLREFPGFDLVVVGEGEHTLVDILRHMDGGEHIPSGRPGTAERCDGGVRVNPPRPLIDDLDELPLPAWSLLAGFPGDFRPSPARIHRWPCASIVLTRGCPNQCTFCDRSVFGRRCRAFSPAYALRLVRDLRDNYGVREILIEDDTFIISKPRVREFCELLLAEAVDVSWSCLGRADRVDADLLKLMRRAGCWHISYGIESGDPEILASVNKHLDVERIAQALVWSRAAGLRTKGFFMVGFPGESRASMEATRALVRTLPLDDISVMQLTPFPGTEIYATAARHGAFERDWRKMNTIQTVFVPHGFTEEDLSRARADILRAFYRRPDVLWRQLTHVVRNPRLMRHMAAALGSFLKVTHDGST